MLSVKSSLGGFTSPYVYAIPADTVIFYNGTYSAAVDGWDIYTDAANKFIVGTATQAEIATTAAASGSSTATATSLSTAGSHYGPDILVAGGYGASPTSSRRSSGEHTHSITANGTASTELKPVGTTITMLRTATEQRFFPANTIHINGTNLVSGTQKLAATSNRYIAGGSAVADTAATSHTMTLTAALYSSGSHSHSLSPYNEYTSTQTSSLQSNGTSYPPSSHTHVVTATATINALKGKLLKLWIAASRQLPKSATVVMYCGNLSLLPPYWKVCNGANGTIDMQGYFLGYATSSATAHGTVTSETNTYTTTGPTAASDNYAHAHYSGGSSYYTQMYVNHSSGTFSHTHAVAGGSVTSDAVPANIKLAFIQLVI
jgi:hypothetical protein